MVLLGRVMVCSHRLSVQTTVVSRTIWPQFAMQVLTESCETPVWGRGGHRGLVIGILSSPLVTSYRLPIVTTPFCFCSFEVLRLATDRHMESKIISAVKIPENSR